MFYVYGVLGLSLYMQHRDNWIRRIGITSDTAGLCVGNIHPALGDLKISSWLFPPMVTLLLSSCILRPIKEMDTYTLWDDYCNKQLGHLSSYVILRVYSPKLLPQVEIPTHNMQLLIGAFGLHIVSLYLFVLCHCKFVPFGPRVPVVCLSHLQWPLFRSTELISP